MDPNDVFDKDLLNEMTSSVEGEEEDESEQEEILTCSEKYETRIDIIDPDPLETLDDDNGNRSGSGFQTNPQSQIASIQIQIPHLQLANSNDCSNNKIDFHSNDSFNDGNEGSSFRKMKQEQMDHLYCDEELHGIEIGPDADASLEESPETKKTNKRFFCCNCKVLISKNSSGRKNFHELLPHQYFDAATGGNTTEVQIVDALSEIFKIQWTYSNYADIYKRDDLELCLPCASVLTELYKLYNEFSSLTIKSKAFLSKIINFQKDLTHNSNEDGVDSSVNANNESSSDEESSDSNGGGEGHPIKKRWKRKRQIKKTQRYGDDDEEDDEYQNPSFETYTQDKFFKSLPKKSRSKFKKATSGNTIPLKKRAVAAKQIKREKPISEESDVSMNFVIGIKKFEFEEGKDTEDDNEDASEYDYDDDEPLHNVVQRISGFPLVEIAEEGQTLECKECNKIFLFPIQLRIHLNSQSHRDKMKELGLGYDVKAGSILPRRRSRKAKPTKKAKSAYKGGSIGIKSCRCGKSFGTNKQLNRHSKICTNFEDGGGECDRCGKKFKTQGGLRIHYAAHVRDDNKYVCKDCGKKFRKMEALELHEKTDHGGFKPHACSQCDKTFRLKDKLKLHIMVIHEKRKPFPCPKCEKAFRTKYHLKIHDVSQHIQGGDNNIGCSQCKRKFPDREALEKHAVVHEQDKPHVCSVCNKGFQTSARLRLHEKSHQEVPSCLCPVCGRAYKHIRDLKLHEVIHQDESTYRFGCGDCPRRFYRIDLLRVHQSNEQHFASEIIGPTVSKSQAQLIGPGGGTRDSSYYNKSYHGEDDNLFLDDDDEDDENETDSESITPIIQSPPKKTKITQKKKQTGDKKNSIKMENTSSSSVRDVTVMHPHATVIYHNQAMVQLHLDQSIVPSSSTGTIRNDDIVSAATGNVSNAALHLTHHQQPRYSHDLQSAAAYALMNQRDGRQGLHPGAAASIMQGIQIQPVSSTSLSHIQISNNAIYTMRDASGNPISNVSIQQDPGQAENYVSFFGSITQ